MLRRRYIILAGAVIVFAGMMVAWPSGSFAFWTPASKRPSDRPMQDTPDEPHSGDSNEGPTLTKRSSRDMGRKPTEEETIAILKTTIISKIDIEDASLEETVAELNRLARSHGVSERELTFLIGPRLSARLRASPFRVRELRIRNVPLIILPKYICDSSKVRWRVRPGRVTFGFSDDFEELPAPAVKEETGPDADPFAEPGVKNQPPRTIRFPLRILTNQTPSRNLNKFQPPHFF